MAVSLVARFAVAGAFGVPGQDFAYANISTNAYALLAGCGLALLAPTLPRRVPRWVIVDGSLVAFVLLLGVSARLPLAYVTTPVLAVVPACPLLLALCDGDPLFAWAPSQFVGRVSYSWYLWHVPLLWLTGTTYHPARGLLWCAVALLIATVSTLFVEEPIRSWWRRRVMTTPANGTPVVPTRAAHSRRRPTSPSTGG